MQTDRELLELVARAAGLEISIWDFSGVPHVMRKGDAQSFAWNPLADDGDALRLAVMLGMIVVIQDSGFVCAEIPGFYPVGEYEWSTAATRRAIVRAAAQMQLLKESK